MKIAKLPKGAKIIKPITKKVGTWVKLGFDAKVMRNGITWLRVKGGFGGRGDREDWGAVLPGISLFVSDYHWNGDSFGESYGSFDNAVKAKTYEALKYAKEEAMKKRKLLSILDASIKRLQMAIRKIT